MSYKEHQERISAYNKPRLQAAANVCDDEISFEEALTNEKGRFKWWQEFCGGVVRVFLGTIQIESDFSLVRGANIVFMKAVTDLFLEGVLSEQQFDMLKAF